MVELQIPLSIEEKERFKNLKMLQDIRNSLVSVMKSLDSQIEGLNNDTIRKIDTKHNVTMSESYTYDEKNERLLHCLGNQRLIEDNIIKEKAPELLTSLADKCFGEMLRNLSIEYKQMKRAEGIVNHDTI